MYWYMETWKIKPAWEALSPEERQEFMAKLKPLVDSLMTDECELVGCIVTDDDTHLHGGFQYGAVWRATDRSHITKIEEGTAAIGWNDYFEQVNHGSRLMSAEEVMQHMFHA